MAGGAAGSRSRPRRVAAGEGRVDGGGCRCRGMSTVMSWELFDPEKVPELNPDPLQEQRLAGIARVREELESAGVEAHSNLDAVRGFRASAVDLAFIRQSVREAWA